MKKIIALLTILTLTMITGVNAESVIFLDDYTNTELKELYDDVRDELEGRGMIKNIDLYPGAYVVGTDIPVGSYKLISVDDVGWSSMYIFWNTDNYNMYKELKQKEDISLGVVVLSNDKYMKIDLSEGYVVHVAIGHLQIEEYEPN